MKMVLYNLGKSFNFSPMGVSWGVTRSECEPCPEMNTEEHEGKKIVFEMMFHKFLLCTYINKSF